jgi:hypothetical protein
MQEHSDPTRKRSQLYYLNIQLLDWIDGAGALGGRCSGFDGRTRQVKVLQVGGIVGRPLASRRFFFGRRPCFPASLLWRLSPRFFGFSSLRSTGEKRAGARNSAIGQI